MNMNYIEILNDDEILEVCRIITAKKLREIYATNPRSFNKLMKFRPQNLTDEQAFAFIVKNKDQKFVAEMFNRFTAKIMADFASIQSKLQENGASQSSAFIDTLAESPFSGNIGLYFRLKGEECTPEKLGAVEYAMYLRRINGENIHRISELEKECSELRKAAAESEDKISQVKSDLHGDIQKLASALERFMNESDGRLSTVIPKIESIISEQESILSSANEAPDDESNFTEGSRADKVTVYASRDKCIEALEDSLKKAGVNNSRAKYLSRFMYSAFARKIPLLLAGPDGSAIAEAFSLTVCGQTPGVLHCEGDFSRQSLNQCRESKSPVVVIDGIFRHDWHIGVIDMLSRREKFCIAVHPFAEDLKLESPGLMDYCLPVITAMFTERFPEGNYRAGHMSDSFSKISHNELDKSYSDLLADFGVNPLAGNIIGEIISDIRSMAGAEDHDNEFIFMLYPAAYLCGKINALRESKAVNISTDARRLLERFGGFDERPY